MPRQSIFAVILAAMLALTAWSGGHAADHAPSEPPTPGPSSATPAPGTASSPGPGTGKPLVATGLMSRGGMPAGMPDRIGPGGQQSWVVELAWQDCGTGTWDPAAPPGELGGTCRDAIGLAAKAAQQYNAAHPQDPPARVKIRLRAGVLAADVRGVTRMDYACPDQGATAAKKTSVPQWWDPEYRKAYGQWLALVNTAIAAAEGDAGGTHLVSDVTMSGAMTCFAEPMMRHSGLKIPGEPQTNAKRLNTAYGQWRQAHPDAPATFYEADLLAWKDVIDIHARTLTSVPSSITVNPFQRVSADRKHEDVWNPTLPGGATLLDYAKQTLGSARLVLENNSVGIEDIPVTCDGVRTGHDLTGTSKELYDAIYCSFRADAATYATHYQSEIAAKFHKDLTERLGHEPSVAENTAAVCEVAIDVATRQRGLTLELPDPPREGAPHFYRQDHPCMTAADAELEANARR